jgi:hypothetical protein
MIPEVYPKPARVLLEHLADEVKRDWHLLLQLQYGAASFGGLSFGLLPGWLYLASRGSACDGKFRYLDALAYVFPKGWLIGRSGCILAHDHPGLRTTSYLGVRYPSGTRFDLAVIEDELLALTQYPKPVTPVTVTIGGLPAEVVYYGAAPQATSGSQSGLTVAVQ